MALDLLGGRLPFFDMVAYVVAGEHSYSGPDCARVQTPSTRLDIEAEWDHISRGDLRHVQRRAWPLRMRTDTGLGTGVTVHPEAMLVAVLAGSAADS